MRASVIDNKTNQRYQQQLTYILRGERRDESLGDWRFWIHFRHSQLWIAIQLLFIRTTSHRALLPQSSSISRCIPDTLSVERVFSWKNETLRTPYRRTRLWTELSMRTRYGIK